MQFPLPYVIFNINSPRNIILVNFSKLPKMQPFQIYFLNINFIKEGFFLKKKVKRQK